MSYQKKGITKPALFFDPPPVESPGVRLGLRYQKRLHVKFINLEFFFYGFAKFLRYTPQNAKLRKSKMRCNASKNDDAKNRDFCVLGEFLRFESTDR